jgi:hypothetical protein
MRREGNKTIVDEIVPFHGCSARPVKGKDGLERPAQVIGIEGFYHVDVGMVTERTLDVLHLCRGTVDDHGKVLQTAVVADVVEAFVTILKRHALVQKNKVCLMGMEKFEQFTAVEYLRKTNSGIHHPENVGKEDPMVSVVIRQHDVSKWFARFHFQFLKMVKQIKDRFQLWQGFNSWIRDFAELPSIHCRYKTQFIPESRAYISCIQDIPQFMDFSQHFFMTERKPRLKKGGRFPVQDLNWLSWFFIDIGF